MACVDENIATCRRQKKGPPIKVGHGDARRLRVGSLAIKLMEQELIEDDENMNHNEKITTGE